MDTIKHKGHPLYWQLHTRDILYITRNLHMAGIKVYRAGRQKFFILWLICENFFIFGQTDKLKSIFLLDLPSVAFKYFFNWFKRPTSFKSRRKGVILQPCKLLPWLRPNPKIFNFTAPTPDPPDYILLWPNRTETFYHNPETPSFGLQKPMNSTWNESITSHNMVIRVLYSVWEWGAWFSF